MFSDHLETIHVSTKFRRKSHHAAGLLETASTTTPLPRASQDIAVKAKSCKYPVDFEGGAPFLDILLAINFNHPFYNNIPVLKRYFEPLFPNYLFCGPEVDKENKHPIVVIPHQKEEYSYFGFMCLVEAIRRKPGFSGYFYVNDDVIINWFHFYKLDRSKIWFPEPHRMKQHSMLPMKIDSSWWKIASCLERCSKAFVEMESDTKMVKINATKIYLENVQNRSICSGSFSELVYIPARFAERYEVIAQKFYDHRVLSDVSIPMSILMLDEIKNMVDITGIFAEAIHGQGPWKLNIRLIDVQITFKPFFVHPFKLTGENRKRNLEEYQERIVVHSENVLKSKCLDALGRMGRYWR